MSIRSKSELLTQINTLFGESPNDEQLGFIEDLSDTISESESVSELQAKMENLDKSWRQKYAARFASSDNAPKAEEADDDEEKPKLKTTYESLFKEV